MISSHNILNLILVLNIYIYICVYITLYCYEKKKFLPISTILSLSWLTGIQKVRPWFANYSFYNFTCKQ